MMPTRLTGMVCAIRRPRPAAILAIILTVGVAVAVSIASPAIAQDGSASSLRPPRVTNDGEPPVFFMYFSAVVIIALAVGANMIPSKRGHQD
ncbi:MAG: hypothetical protein AAGF47_00805 [Planctomycetota bacterium]